MSEIVKCARCKTNKKIEFFKIRNNTGARYKTCMTCCERRNCDNNHNCNKCDKKYSSKSNMDMHINRVHNKIKKFGCDKCDMKFSDKGDLDRHIKSVHNKIKDFGCDKCDKKFSVKTNLDRHVNSVHYKIKNFNCDNCDKKFSAKADLAHHIVICTGELKISSGEYQVIKALTDLGFEEDKDYHHNNRFHELTTWCDRPLRFDFRFENHKIMIEYDGRQHYMPVRFGSMSQELAEENFKIQQNNDKLKDEFCKEFGYKMIRISYKDFSKVLEILSGELFDIVNWIG